jgi:hypothetical protein
MAGTSNQPLAASHAAETRCNMRDPDGHLIEVGEAKK